MKKLFNPPRRENYIHRVDAEQALSGTIKNFTADLIGGNLVILAGEDNVCRYRLQWREEIKVEEQPKLTLLDGELSFRSKSFKPFVRQKDAYVIELILPAQVNVNIRMFAGTVYIENIIGELEVKLTAGDVNVIGPTQCSNISVWAGNIHLHQVCGSVSAKVKLGDATTLFAEMPPENAEVNLSTWLGDVSARFPQGFLLTDNSIKTMPLQQNTTGAKIALSAKLGDVKVDHDNCAAKGISTNG
ncbi:MAG: hypothetical protein GY821_16140 [Gammaproteobacteria bacterium]|nr:hypothetical protein [Gammaproteobacteria bacterium]